MKKDIVKKEWDYMEKMRYEAPRMYAEIFVANQYVAACEESIKNVPPTTVRCISWGHDQTQTNTMFLDDQVACDAKFNPGVGFALGNWFYTEFEACAYVNKCNKQSWLGDHPNDTSFEAHVQQHGTYNGDKDGFINHKTMVNLSLAEKYQLS